MASFLVEGGHPLIGDITPQGAKNEALQVVCATLLTGEEVKISNIPEILDVANLIDLLRQMGVRVDKTAKGEYIFCADRIDENYVGSEEFASRCAKLRGSVMLTGPLLARFHKAALAKPGGDNIGTRRLDTHLRGLSALGAQFEINEESNICNISARKLKGKYILLDEASVLRNSKHCYGSHDGGRRNHYIQCRLRAIPSTTLQDARKNGSKHQRHRFKPSHNNGN